MKSIRRNNHVAVRLEQYILVFGGLIIDGAIHEPVPSNEIWMYHLYTEQWRKTTVTLNGIEPPRINGASATAIRSDIYIFGGQSDSLWKLTRTVKGRFAWQKIKSIIKKKSPSPRIRHTAWEFSEKVWIFGGRVLSSENPSDYLNNYGDFGDWGENNQILCFDPSCNEWTNPQSFGDIPTHREGHGTAPINDRIWLYGGSNSTHNEPLDDLYYLDMHSLTWTMVRKCGVKSYFPVSCTVNALTEKQLLVHHGEKGKRRVTGNWIILDLSSMSWKKYSTPLDSKYGQICYSLACTQGINSSAMVIVGKDFPYVAGEEPVPWKAIRMTLQAKSLQQLAMQTIWKYNYTLPWQEILPTKLRNIFGFRGYF